MRSSSHCGLPQLRRGSGGRSGVQEDLALKLHLCSRSLLSVQHTDPFIQMAFCLRQQGASLALCLLTVLVGGQLDGALQQVFPVRSLDHRGCHLLLFPAQGAADRFVGHLQATTIISLTTVMESDINKFTFLNVCFLCSEEVDTQTLTRSDENRVSTAAHFNPTLLRQTLDGLLAMNFSSMLAFRVSIAPESPRTCTQNPIRTDLMID